MPRISNKIISTKITTKDWNTIKKYCPRPQLWIVEFLENHKNEPTSEEDFGGMRMDEIINSLNAGLRRKGVDFAVYSTDRSKKTGSLRQMCKIKAIPENDRENIAPFLRVVGSLKKISMTQFMETYEVWLASKKPDQETFAPVLKHLLQK